MSAIENLGDPAIRDGLSWYLAVAESEPPNWKVAFGGPGCAGDVAQPCCSQVETSVRRRSTRCGAHTRQQPGTPTSKWARFRH